jgi:exopolysaccharide biosynthesis polyprenyl glycosylphosphotransferase
MAITLALLEGALLFAVVCSAIFLWVHPLLVDWIDLLALLSQALGLSLCCIVAFYYNDLYDLRIVRTFGDFLARLLQSFGVAFIFLAGFYTLFPDTKLAGGPFVSSVLIILVFLLPLRALSYAAMRSRRLVERVLILGSGPLVGSIVSELEAQPHFRSVVLGVVDDSRGSAGVPAGYPHLGSLERLDEILAETKPDCVIVGMAERRGRLPLRSLLAARMSGVEVVDAVEVYERLTGKLAIESLSPSSLIFSRAFRKSRVDLVVGRVVSLVASVVGLVALAPLMALIAVVIRLDSRGPALFIQDRIGLHGKRFRLMKFRTMHPEAVHVSEWVRDNTDRVTRVGYWLRKYRLDELPQFVNIFRGDMNLVGPRPHPVSNHELFRECIPYYALRSEVRPGVTGWAQVRYGYANNLDEEIEKMRYDLYYIKHLSALRDLRILVDTVKIVFFGLGSRTADAYRVEAASRAGQGVVVPVVGGVAHASSPRLPQERV